MYKKIVSLSISFATLCSTVTSLQAETTSFNCKAKDLASAEKLICMDAELAGLDRELATVFAKAVEIDTESVNGTLPTEQRGWIKGRNECWKEGDLRACVVASYLRRIAELQAKYRLFSPVSSVSYVCEGNPAHELVVSYFSTKQRSIVAEHGDDTFYLFEDSKDHYQGRNETLTVRKDSAKGDAVEFVSAYGAAPLTCVGKVRSKPTIDPSWDKDENGINDCELDGSCDHTVDYTKPNPGEFVK